MMKGKKGHPPSKHSSISHMQKPLDQQTANLSVGIGNLVSPSSQQSDFLSFQAGMTQADGTQVETVHKDDTQEGIEDVDVEESTVVSTVQEIQKKSLDLRQSFEKHISDQKNRGESEDSFAQFVLARGHTDVSLQLPPDMASKLGIQYPVLPEPSDSQFLPNQSQSVTQGTTQGESASKLESKQDSDQGSEATQPSSNARSTILDGVNYARPEKVTCKVEGEQVTYNDKLIEEFSSFYDEKDLQKRNQVLKQQDLAWE